MLHILSFTPAWRSDAVLSAMFAARKRVFVDLLGWNVPVADEAFEVDEFDRPGAVYLVLTAPDGRHHASARLLPTDRPHLLDSLFADLCATPPPTGPSIREITRFCLDRDLDARKRRCARNGLVSALVDHALATGIATYTGVAELGWFRQIMTFGWECRALGAPVRSMGQTLAAMRIDVAPDTPALLAGTGIYTAANRQPEVRHAA